MTFRTGAEALRAGAARLARSGIDLSRLEARLLLAHAAGMTATALLRDLRQPVDAPGYESLLARREAREPLAYLLGRREFWSLEFEVSRDTLIPRPDSETVIEAALAASPAPGRVLDLGTGTGCLLLSVLHERQAAWGVGVDIDPGAAALAARNATALDLGRRATFLCADWAAPLSGRFDLVLCNPPYIPAGDIEGLMPEVAAHEPRRALDGGPDGLRAYRHLAGVLPGLLAPGGVAVLELGAGQDADVSRLMRQAGLEPGALHADISGIPRALVVRSSTA